MLPDGGTTLTFSSSQISDKSKAESLVLLSDLSG
jgi:hypothetical protein